jgi:hypothetical protein
MSAIKRTVRRHRGGAGYSIPAFSEEIDWPEKETRRAVALGIIQTVDFGDRKRIPFSEKQRLRDAGLVRPAPPQSMEQNNIEGTSPPVEAELKANLAASTSEVQANRANRSRDQHQNASTPAPRKPNPRSTASPVKTT